MAGKSSLTLSGQDWLLLVLLSVLWGGSFVFAKLAITAMPPLTVVMLRVALAALTLFAVLRMLGLALPRDFASWRDFLVMGALNNALPFALIFWAQQEIASGLAAILNATTPLFTILIAQVATSDEKAGWGKGLGAAIGLGGVAVMIGLDYLAHLGAHLAAELAVIGAAIAYGCAGIWGRRFKGRSPWVVACGQLSASTALISPIALILDRPWELPMPPPAIGGAILALALFSTALAYAIFFRLLARAGATNLLLVTFLIPVSALGLGYLFFGERLFWQHGLGLAAILAGLALIDGRPAAYLAAMLRRGAAPRSAP